MEFGKIRFERVSLMEWLSLNVAPREKIYRERQVADKIDILVERET